MHVMFLKEPILNIFCGQKGGLKNKFGYKYYTRINHE